MTTIDEVREWAEAREDELETIIETCRRTGDAANQFAASQRLLEIEALMVALTTAVLKDPARIARLTALVHAEVDRALDTLHAAPAEPLPWAIPGAPKKAPPYFPT